jgi:hypothetical protein
MSSYLLDTTLVGVKIESEQIGPVFRIPALSKVLPLGMCPEMPALIEIEWRRETYAVFPEDLTTRSEPCSRSVGRQQVYGSLQDGMRCNPSDTKQQSIGTEMGTMPGRNRAISGIQDAAHVSRNR